MLPIVLCVHRTLTSVWSGQNLNSIIGIALDENYLGHALSDEERASSRYLIFTALRHWGLISAQINALCKARPKPPVLTLIGIALTQIQFSHAKSYAIVDHAVSATKNLGLEHNRGFVNGVLRNFLRQQESLSAEKLNTDEARFNFPNWWIRKLQRQWPDRFAELLLTQNTHPPFTLRVNEQKTTVYNAGAALEAQGFDVVTMGASAIQVSPPADVNKLAGFANGHLSVQDLGAQLAVEWIDLGACIGARVLDACSAPGGKTAHLLEKFSRSTVDQSPLASLLALDMDATRLNRVRANLDRLGLSCDSKVADAAKLETWWDGVAFDRILLDAPCSASGTARRNPDIRWNRRESDIKTFVQAQARLLEALWQTLKPGGKLLYATCSVFAEENQLQIDAFTKRNRATIETLEPFLSTGPRIEMHEGTVLPSKNNDGFFYARLVKR